ncbi:hypothetical protein KKF81_01305 [Candidatus Micrarchaeota archaeon]|nr:hypothetical protein [Candidatus Micrarchaeota archaeon]MBU1165557.1 hypothetical protein [Candidatus Micrarchaeota archaeon]MBU1886500.1 hypothetical protein [Candidatus Micrarchaeota archaeon]
MIDAVVPIISIQSFFGDNGATWMAGWLPLCIMAVITALIIYNIFLMIARAFSLREVEAFAKSEMLQTMATAFMAIFLVGIVEGTMVLSQQFIGGTVDCGTTPIHIGEDIDHPETTMDDAYDAIRCRLQERAVAVAAIQDRVNTDTYWDYFSLNLAVSLFGITVFKGDWLPTLYKKTEINRIINNLSTVLLIALNAQSILLQYLQTNMLSIFIPIGILLRSFYFTRGPGALFLALGIGMYFIFPIFFVLLDPGFVASPPPPATAEPQQQPFCYATMSNAVTILKTVESAGLGSNVGLSLSASREGLSKSYIALIMHPLIAFFLTMVFVKYMMTILGGDTYELTRMVSKVV